MTKTEDAHTPGPWIAAAGPSSVVGWPVVSSEGRSICRLTWFERAVPAGEADETKAETLANARLIAAAPDLLEACRAALNMVEGDGFPPNWDLLRAAIAKAEGNERHE